ncbi:MAG TPA: metallophosphoesterase [Candidatus Salinicoccus stercoripullorum]|uniref:Metallophosphoesterase n=1 Tax=Candidatus Salinicoccus stercoripullorum TaxID=2838756 RepID=A0A9D1QJ00_9STAP|nr:metallophosphoesterase [Candidatus Salinicoccus stercoripullorum]
MKIGIISDLHIDRGKAGIKTYETLLSEEVKSRQLDLLLIAGDVSSHYTTTAEFLENIRNITDTKILFVPGNHDYWLGSGDDMTTQDVYEFYKAMPGSLLESPYTINDDWAIVGHSGWYDYTYADTRFGEEKLARGKFYGGTWQDKLRVDWEMHDRELSRVFADKVDEDMKKTGGRNIILMTHVVTHRRYAVPMPHRLFDYFNAFIGTSDFDALYKKYPIRYSIMGHVHFRHQFIQDDLTYICACLGYPREWRTDDIKTEIQNTLQVLEI